MKKLVLIAALVLLPLFASAQEAVTLLTADGTLYALDQQKSASSNNVRLVLSIRGEDGIRREIVPATMSDGKHANAAMAYDPQSKTLFVFWLHHVGLLNSQLLVCSLDANGNWSEAITFGQPFDYRENLRIAVTRKVLGQHAQLESGLTVHAAWWETDTHTGNEFARYAVLGVENGILSEPVFLDLVGELPNGELNQIGEPLADMSVLRYPVLTPSAKQESVLVTFGNLATRRMHRLRVYPTLPPAVGDGRIRIPVGRSEGSIETPKFQVAANSSVQGIQGENNDTLALYVRDDDQLRYVLFRDGSWSDARAITLDGQITAPAAIEAIRRLVHEN